MVALEVSFLFLFFFSCYCAEIDTLSEPLYVVLR